ncbi:MAG TPA: calcium-binding protein [Steroidobacteraceae bacterium]|nr:calcium-binding protein [Steroidobacteraceae bacterium]
MSISIGELKQFHHDMQDAWSDLTTGLTNAMAEAGGVLTTGAQLSEDAARMLGRNVWHEFDSFQARAMQRLHDILPAEQLAQYRGQIMDAMRDFEARGAAAEEALGRAVAETAYQNSLRNIGKWGGPVVDGAQLANAIYNGLQTGSNDALAKVMGDIYGGAIGGALGALLAAGIVSFFGLMGVAAAAATFLIVGALAVAGAIFLGPLFGWGWNEILDGVADLYNAASNWIMRRDPLTLDLDGDGIESIGLSNSNTILFDHDGDGIRNGTGWVSSDDGFLVLDRNGNGAIDSGRELFGDSTLLPDGTAAADGFAALAAEDTNADGVVNAADARFAQLRVWRDLNQDGQSTPNELFTLQQLGIIGINVASVARDQVLGNGNRIADVGSYIRTDGSEGAVGETHGAADVDLAGDTFHREFTDQIPLVEAVEDLPNLSGSGRVRDLWEAASQSPALLAILDEFSAATTRAEQLALIDTLLLQWARTAGMQDMSTRAEAINHRFGWWRIGEATYPGSGTAWVAGSGGSGGTGAVSMPAGFPDPDNWENLRDQWDALVQRTNNLFTVLEAFNGRYFFSMPEDTFQGARAGVTMVAAGSNGGGGSTAISADPRPGITIGIAQAQLDALTGSYETLRDFVYNALALQTRHEVLTDSILVDFVPGGGIEFDYTDLHAELRRRIEADAVAGMADLIEYTRGMSRRLTGMGFSGLDMIQEYVAALPASPALEALYEEFGLRYATGVAATDNGAENADIIIGRNQAGNEVESLRGGGGADILLGNAGRDYMYGEAGVDTLIGGAGDDYLYGGANEDVLAGGAGNDHLNGEGGDDVFVFGRGDGQDVVNAYDLGVDKRDELRLGPDVGINDVLLTRYSSDLVVSIVGTTDRITISNFFYSDDYAINGIRLSDGTLWDIVDIKAKVQTGTSGHDVLTAHVTGSSLYGAEGDDTLNGSARQDVLDGGAGNDTAEGGAGDDIINDTSGANLLRGGEGADTIHGSGTIEGGTGNDTLSGASYSPTVYVYNLGDGIDTITDYGYGSAAYADTLQLGAGIVPGSFSFVRTGNDLTLRFSETDQITVKNWFADVYYNAIERIAFADGTVWDQATMQQLAIDPFTGTSGNDTINGWDGIDIIDGGDGNDTLNGAGGSDTLAGSLGNDTLRGGEGNDALTGGDGNDNLNGDGGNDTVEGGEGDDVINDSSGANVLRGGAGADTISGNGIIEGGTGNDALTGASHSSTVFVYNLGDGIDTITDYGYGTATYADTLQLGAGITPASVTLIRTGNDMLFRFSETDQITVKNWYSDVYYNAIERITFADGTVWTHDTMYGMTTTPFVGTSTADTISGWEGIDIIDGGDGNDTLNGAGGTDTLAGGLGNDTLRGGDGNDALTGGDGNDNLNGDAGNDTLEGGIGDDVINDSSGANLLRGGAGADTISGNGTIEGGTGNDALTGASHSSTVFVYNLGDGIDTITDYGYGTAAYADTLQLGAGITPASVTFIRTGNDLTFRFSETDQITVKNWFADVYYNGIELVTFADGTVWDQATMQTFVGQQFVGTSGNDTINGWGGIDLIDGAEGNDTIYGMGGNDSLSGGSGNDTIRGGDGNDLLAGGEGDDNLQGEGGNDTLEGGEGSDTITDSSGANALRGGAGADIISGNGTIDGGTGNDTLTGASHASTVFVYNLGDGIDTITDYGYGTAAYADTLQLGAGITPASVTLTRIGNDMLLRFSETDQVTVKNWFADVYYNAIENVTFADGTVWTHATMYGMTTTPFVGTSAADTINGWEGIDIIDGGDGNDTLNGAGGTDTLTGGSGNDTLRGGDAVDTLHGGDGNDNLNGDGGNDTLEGGAGDDVINDSSGANVLRGGVGADTINGNGTIEGGAGNDTLTGASHSSTVFVYNLGDGIDTITDYGYGTAAYADTLQLGAGITPASVTLTRVGNDLLFRISETDQVTVKNWFADVYYNAIENVTFADGTVWNHAAMYGMTTTQFAGTAAADTINGWEGIDIIDGGDGNDTLNGAGGTDTLTGGSGNDTLRGGDAVDTLQGGDGNDNLNGDGGNDTLDGGAGDDVINDSSGANLLRGGAGADTISGNGTIDGGTGNDALTGASHSSTVFVYNLGDGIDTITDYGYGTAAYADTLQLGAGITPASVTLTRVGNDLLFRISETDQITVKNWYSDVYYNAIENVTFADGTVWNHAAMYGMTTTQFAGTSAADTINGWEGVDIIDGGDGNDTLNGAGGVDTLSGSAGNDTLRGGDGNDSLLGGDGNDNLNGDGGNDTLDGGAGDDVINDSSGTNVLRGGAGADTISGNGTIDGGAGNDTLTGASHASTVFVYNLGDGIDTITDYGYGTAAYADTLQLGAGITPASVTLVRTGNDLLFRISETDQITVKNWYSDVYYNAIENVTFADGTVWNHAMMYGMTTTPFTGTSAADTINGWEGIDIIDGGDGNDALNGAGGVDTLSGSAGNDTLRGGEGNDALMGGDGNDNLNGDGGNDTLEGGVGDDVINDSSGANVLRGGAGADTISGNGTIDGGAGNDTLTGASHSSTVFVYNLGDGIDTITDYGYGTAAYADTLQLGAGITPASVTLIRTGNDLTFRFSDTDKVTVKNWYADVYYNAIERVTFADGTVWDVAAIQGIPVQQNSSGSQFNAMLSQRLVEAAMTQFTAATSSNAGPTSGVAEAQSAAASWSLMDAVLDFRGTEDGSPDGDFAADLAPGRGLNGIGFAPAPVANDTGFGVAAPGLRGSTTGPEFARLD